MPPGKSPPGSNWRLKALFALAIILAIATVIAWRDANGYAGPRLTEEQVATIPDDELMRLIRIILIARASSRMAHHDLDPDVRPVSGSISFEEGRLGLDGLPGALASNGGSSELATLYERLGAQEVAACLRRIGDPRDEQATASWAAALEAKGLHQTLQQTLHRAGLERARAAWVRAHPQAFVRLASR